MLVERLHHVLPQELNAIVEKTSYSKYSSEQAELCERLIRVIEVSEKYGPPIHGSIEKVDYSPDFSLASKDRKRVAYLCEQMRKIVFASTFFDQPHKVRLLNRIAAIETETMKPKGKLDTVLAGLVDTGDALGSFGIKVKPLTDRMKEVANLARKGSEQYRQLPAPEDQLSLPAPGNEQEE